ncbi:uncharacterized protein LOC130450786 [Diorhabda sublineata]|uniref:uncharacterized protein LOC130450786 n=1 Tax=Diorhabda sublineata TaxID=1163346 RepID=UPI0024E13848|nr:uncharacterized protein LOC130450786 [Diorhabda sublineata]
MYTIPVFIAVIGAFLKIDAYNFENPDYNQILANDLEELYSTSHFVNIRDKRDTSNEIDGKCSRRGPKVCCDDMALKKIREGQKEYKNACFKEVVGKDKPDKRPHEAPFDPFDCEKMRQRRSEIVCISQCVGQKNNYIDDDGKIKPYEFEEYMKNKLEDITYLAPVVDKIIAGCVADIKNATMEDEKCKPDGIVSEFCIFKNIQLNCPDDQIKNKEACMKFQKMLKEGQGPPPVGFLPPPDFHGPPPGFHGPPPGFHGPSAALS